MPIRAQHWTDDALDGRERRRVLRNWANYELPSGLWDAAEPDVVEASEAPPDWQGAFEFTHRNLRAALQSFVGDSTDKANTALWGLRLSARPSHWLNIKALDVDSSAPPELDRAKRTATWRGLWAHCDLRLTLAEHKVAKEIVLREPGHPASFRFSLRYPGVLSHVVEGNRLRVFDQRGALVFDSFPAHGIDADGRPVPVRLVAGETVRGRPAIEIVPDAEDLEAAVYPVTIDPTVTIGGTSALQDAFIFAASAGANWGGHPQLFAGNLGAAARVIARVDPAQIPAGTITAARMLLWRFSAFSSSASGVLQSFAVADANTWVEGTAAGTPEAGVSTWNGAKEGSQAWAGSAGCGTSGTDFDADANPPELAYGPNSPGSGGSIHQITVPLKGEWFAAWRDATRVNNGWLIRDRDEGAGQLVSAASTENTDSGGIYVPSVEVDYTEAAATKPHYYARLLARARR